MSGFFLSTQRYLALVGRILISYIFITSGWGKIFHFVGTAAAMGGKGLPFPEILLVLTILVELGGGLMILLGWHARWAALALFLWLIPVTLVFHRFWGIDPAAVQNQHINFIKNVTIMGGMAYVMAFGSGRLSLTRES